MSEYDSDWAVVGKVALGAGVIAALGFGGYKVFNEILQSGYDNGFRDGEKTIETALEAKEKELRESGRLIDQDSCFRFRYNTTQADQKTYQVVTCGNLKLTVTDDHRFSTLRENDYEVTRGVGENSWGRETSEGFAVHKYKTEKVEVK